jgi:hypothetical protein
VALCRRHGRECLLKWRVGCHVENGAALILRRLKVELSGGKMLEP